jgi:hypothetical protein
VDDGKDRLGQGAAPSSGNDACLAHETGFVVAIGVVRVGHDEQHGFRAKRQD